MKFEIILLFYFTSKNEKQKTRMNPRKPKQAAMNVVLLELLRWKHYCLLLLYSYLFNIFLFFTISIGYFRYWFRGIMSIPNLAQQLVGLHWQASKWKRLTHKCKWNGMVMYNQQWRQYATEICVQIIIYKVYIF